MVQVGPEFAALAGRRRLLATGQPVWTVTSAPGVGQVRLLIEGRPLATPTDSGLTLGPVDRADYASVFPVPVPP